MHLAVQQRLRPTRVTPSKQPAPRRPVIGERPFYLARQQAKLKSVLIAGFQFWAIPRAKHSLSHPAPHPFKAPSTRHNKWHNIFFFSLLTVVSRFVVGSNAGSWGGDGLGRGVFYNNTPTCALKPCWPENKQMKRTKKVDTKRWLLKNTCSQPLLAFILKPAWSNDLPSTHAFSTSGCCVTWKAAR